MAFYQRDIVWSKNSVAVQRETLKNGENAFMIIVFDTDRELGRLGQVWIACKDEVQAMALAELLSSTVAIAVSES